MKAVQTFWSGDNNPLVDSFGWLSPQYNLMSWAFSCLSLKENYEDVVLYTDSKGYTIFHDYLKLPYKEIIVQYDNLNCHRDIWAYAKLLTYSLQDTPFIHVDGDVYLPHRLSKEVESGALIAQNAEVGTSCYRSMVDDIMSTPHSTPYCLFEELKKESISSYNAGVLGGNDLEFIKEYCQAAFEFIEYNNLRDVNRQDMLSNHNIVYEQILFHVLAEKKNKKVSTILDHSIDDNGYGDDEFCDFYSFNKKELMHIIGGHKRNERICELLSRALLNKYPEYYQRIVDLFSANHRRLDPTRSYNNFLDKLSVEWDKISHEDLFEQERKSTNYLRFLDDYSKEEQMSTVIKKNPYLSIYKVPQDWNANTKQVIKNRISNNFHADNFDIACIPDLLGNGYREVLIDDISFNILTILQEQQTLGDILEKITSTLSPDIKDDETQIHDMVQAALERLFYNKLTYVN